MDLLVNDLQETLCNYFVKCVCPLHEQKQIQLLLYCLFSCFFYISYFVVVAVEESV